MRGSEEQSAVDSVGDDVLAQQAFLFLRDRVECVQRNLLDPGGSRNSPQGQHRSEPDADRHRRHQIEDDRDEEGRHHHHGVAAARTSDRSNRRGFDHAHRRRQEYPGEGCERNVGHQPGGGVHDGGEDHGMGERCEPGSGTGSNVDRSAGDGTGGRYPAEQRRGDVRQPLPEQFTVGVVPRADAHRVRSGRGQQRFEGRERSHGERRCQQRRHVTEVEEAQARGGQRRRDRADAGDVEVEQLGDHRCSGDSNQRERDLRSQAATDEHDDRDRDGHGRRQNARVRDERAHGVERGLPHLLTLGIGDTQGRRNLLQRNDDGDAGGEPFDDGCGHVPDGSTDAGGGEREQDEPGHQPDCEHAGRPVFGDDRHEHHRHGTGRTGHLEPRPTEYRGDDAGNDRRRQAGRGTQPGADAEAERQGQRDKGHDQTGQQIRTGRTEGGFPFAPSGQERCHSPRGVGPTGGFRRFGHVTLSENSSILIHLIAKFSK